MKHFYYRKNGVSRFGVVNYGMYKVEEILSATTMKAIKELVINAYFFACMMSHHGDLCFRSRDTQIKNHF